MIENRDEMIYIHDKKVKNISEFYLLYDIINPPKSAKNTNSHYSPILHGNINNRIGREIFRTSKLYWTVDVVKQF